MNLFDLASLIVAIAALAVALAVAISGRQLIRPRFSLTIGTLDCPKGLFRRRAALKSTVMYGLPRDIEQAPLFAWMKITNIRKLPVADVEVELQFPVGSLIEGAGVLAPIFGGSALVTAEPFPGREIHRTSTRAQVRIKLGTLRPKETKMVCEPLQLRTGQLLVDDDDDQANIAERLRSRYADIEALRSAITVRVVVWSSSVTSLSQVFNLVWCAAVSESELVATLGSMCQAAGKELKPGIYVGPPWRSKRRLERYEFAELVLLDWDNTEESVASALSPETTMNAANGLALMRLPPWGLWAKAFDLQSALGFTLIRRYRQEDGPPPPPRTRYLP